MTLRDTICGDGGGVFINSNWRSFFCETERDSSRQHAVNLHIWDPIRETRFAFLGPPGCEEELPEATDKGRVGYMVFFLIIQTEDREEFCETAKKRENNIKIDLLTIYNSIFLSLYCA